MSNVIQFTIKGVDKFSNVTGKLVSGFSKAARAVTKFSAISVAALAAIGLPIINTAKKFETLEASLKTVTGSAEAASKAMAGIKTFAQETPFQVTEITDAFIKLTALGLTPSEEALRSYGNTASAMGKSLDQMIEAIADATTGEFERLKEFGIRARSEGDKVSFTFQNVTTTVGKNAKDINAFLTSIGENQFAGAMTDQMDTLKGKLSNMMDTVDNLFDTIGRAGLLDLVKDAVSGITESIKNSTDGIIRFGIIVATAFSNIKKAISDSIGSDSLFSDFLSLAFDTFIKVFDIVSSVFTKLIPVIVDSFEIAFIAVFKTVQLAMVKVLEVILNGFPNVMIAIGGMFVALWEGVKAGADWAMRAVQSIFNDIEVEPLSELLFNGIPKATEEARSNIVSSLGEIEFVSPSFTEFFKEEIPKLTADARDTLSDNMDAMMGSISNGVAVAGEGIKNLFGIDMEEINALTETTMARLNEFSEGMLESVESTTSLQRTMWEELTLSAEEYMSKVGSLQQEISSGIFQLSKDMIKSTSDAVGESIVSGQKLSKAFEGVLKKVAASAISMLVKIGLQRLILGNITQGANLAEVTSQAAPLPPLAAAGGVASMAAAPFPINLTAPAFGAQMFSLAAGNSAAAIAAATPVPLRDGLDRVPYDNMVATLHKDEAVLTAQEASEFRGSADNSSGGNTIVIEALVMHVLENATSFEAIMEMDRDQIRTILEEKLIPEQSNLDSHGIHTLDIERTI